jgi:hypothetical protein
MFNFRLWTRIAKAVSQLLSKKARWGAVELERPSTYADGIRMIFVGRAGKRDTYK